MLVSSVVLTTPCSAVSAASNPQKQQTSLVFGILPFMSPIALYKRFAPLSDHLSQQLDKSVIIETSRDFAEHQQKTRTRRYDFLLTAPHFVIPAVNTGHYRVIATYRKPLSAVVIVHNNSQVKSMRDLLGKTVATPPDSAIITMIGKKMLRRVDPKRSIKFKTYRTHNAAYEAVLGGEAQAAVVAIYVFKGALKSKAPLKIITRSKNFPSVGILAATDLPKKVVNKFLRALTSMTSKPRGRHILRKIAFPGYRKASKDEYVKLGHILSSGAPETDKTNSIKK